MWWDRFRKTLGWLIRRSEPYIPQTPTGEQEQPLEQQEVLKRIERNGGPNGLSLENCNLSDIDLSFKAVRENLDTDRRGQAAWYSSATHGINLKGAILRNANLSGIHLAGADLSEATLNEAQMELAICHDVRFVDSYLLEVKASQAEFQHADMRGCYLNRADLRGADLSHARLQGADLSHANLTGAVLCNARLVEADFTGASVRGVNWFGAWLNNTLLNRQQIGEKLVQEQDATYQHPEPKHIDQLHPHRAIPGRYAQAASIYRALKNNFQSIGSYDDARWAYIKERKMRRLTHWPPGRVRDNYVEEFNQLPKRGLKGKWEHLKFYARHLFTGIADWFFEVTSGYGEKPSLAFYWALVLVFGFAVLFRWTSGVRGPDTWLDYLNYSLGMFVTIGFGEFEAVHPAAKALSSLEAILGVCILALLMFALGNRVNRS